MKKIVVIGRPNVGKSSFINRLLGKKMAITAREEGVTRDIRYYDQVWNGKSFKICDTGGVIDPQFRSCAVTGRTQTTEAPPFLVLLLHFTVISSLRASSGCAGRG